jgi:hypothetical protein
MKKNIIYLLVSLACVLMTSCVEDKMYEGPATISSIKFTPSAPTSNDNVVVKAKIEGLQSITSAQVVYTVNGGSSNSVNMSLSDSTYSATIPAQADKAVVVFKIVAVNSADYTATSDSKTYTVGNPAADYTKLVLNELYGAASTDDGKYIELYNNSAFAISLTGVTIQKDGALAWTGIDGESVPAKGYFVILGAKGSTLRGISTGFSAKKNVLVKLFDPSGNAIDTFQRGEEGTGWGNTSLTAVTGSWSRCPDGTGKFKITDVSQGTANPTTGTDDTTIVQ